MAGIYLHIPFCKQACIYCDFHFSTNTRTSRRMAQAIANEAIARKDYLGKLSPQSLYFGGGTPSQLTEAELELIFKALNENYSLSSLKEVTLEANPDDINPQQLKWWKSLGINRLSIGLQSFDDKELKWMNRAHRSEQSVDCVKMAQDFGFANLSVDLIYGSRFQNEVSWQNALDRVIELGVIHVSAYNLTIEKKTRLGLLNQRGEEPPVEDERSNRFFLMMKQSLEGAGFVHYEVSNFARPGYEAVHNSSYWFGKPYLGLGPSAHSFNGTERRWNVKSNAAYMNAVEQKKIYFETEQLSTNNRYNEYVMTRLRTRWGCDLNEMEKLFGETYVNHFLSIAGSKQQVFLQQENVFRLTDQGLLMADRIASDLFLI